MNRAALILLIALTAAAIPAQEKGQATVLSAQRLMVRQKYVEAEEQIRGILKREPGNIDALYTLAAIEQTRILDYEAYTIYGKRFQALADSLLSALEARQPRLRGDDSVRCLFYRANILGGMGVIQAKRGAWIDGARSAMGASGLYKQVKKADPNHRGADLGLGVFDYYFGTSLKWIPFAGGGSVDRGLEALERALNAPFPFNNAAKSTYSWILIERKQFKRADSLAASALAETPGNTIFLRIRAHIALWTGCYDDALVLGRKLAAASEARAPVNWSDLMASYYIISSALDNLGRKADAYAEANKALGLPLPEEYKAMPHVKEHIKFLTKVK